MWRRFALLLYMLGGTPAIAVAADGNASTEATTFFATIVTPAKFIGFPRICPGEEPPTDVAGETELQSICLAELYEAKVRVLKRLDGPAIPRTLTVRFTAHSFHRVWQPERLFLLKTVPFHDEGTRGHFAYRWDWEDENQNICLNEESLAEESEAIRKYFERNGRRRTTGEDDRNWGENIHLRCIR